MYKKNKKIHRVREVQTKYKTIGTKKNYELQVLIEQDEDGVYIASCPVLESCYTQGTTFEGAIENIKDVIKICLDELKEKIGKDIGNAYSIIFP